LKSRFIFSRFKINWNLLDCDSFSTAFRDVIIDNYLYQHVRQPTKIEQYIGFLDLVISSLENMVNDIQVLEHLGNSDHNIFVWKLICDAGLTKNKKPTREYHKADYESMKEWPTNIDWNEECEEVAVEDMWQKVCFIINHAIYLFVPLGHSKNRNNEI
jgi:hypothetical protein